jgi:hypothetical protein
MILWVLGNWSAIAAAVWGGWPSERAVQPAGAGWYGCGRFVSALRALPAARGRIRGPCPRQGVFRPFRPEKAGRANRARRLPGHSMLRIVAPPNAGPYPRWCGEDRQRWRSLPDYQPFVFRFRFSSIMERANCSSSPSLPTVNLKLPASSIMKSQNSGEFPSLSMIFRSWPPYRNAATQHTHIALQARSISSCVAGWRTKYVFRFSSFTGARRSGASCSGAWH